MISVLYKNFLQVLARVILGCFSRFPQWRSSESRVPRNEDKGNFFIVIGSSPPYWKRWLTQEQPEVAILCLFDN